MHIEPLAEAGLEPLLELYRHLHPTEQPPPTDVATARWAAILAMPGHCVFGGWEDDQLVASCALQLIPNLTRGGRPYGLLENVVTRTERRRRGLGRQVVQAALDHAWAHDAYKVMLLARSANERATAFYEAIGFDPHTKQGFLATPP